MLTQKTMNYYKTGFRDGVKKAGDSTDVYTRLKNLVPILSKNIKAAGSDIKKLRQGILDYTVPVESMAEQATQNGDHNTARLLNSAHGKMTSLTRLDHVETELTKDLTSQLGLALQSAEKYLVH